MALALTVVVLKSALKITRLDYKRWAWASRILQPIRFSSFTICQDVTSGCSGSLSILFSLHRESGCYLRGETSRFVWWHLELCRSDITTHLKSGRCVFAAVIHGVLQGVTRGVSGSKECVFSPTDSQTGREGGRMFQSSSWTQTCCLLWLTECGRTMQK